MKYKEPVFDAEEKKEEQDESSQEFDAKSNPLTQHKRMETSIERDNVLMDENSMKKFRPRIFAISKFLPMGNYHRPETKRLFNLRKLIIDLEQGAGLDDDAMITSLDMVGDSQFSRGVGGFYSQLERTARHEVKDFSATEKSKGLKNLFMKKGKEENPEDQYKEEY